MSQKALIFCGQPLADRPVGQRIGELGRFLGQHGWQVHLASVDPRFDSEPFTVRDEAREQSVEIIGPSHFRLGADGSVVPRGGGEYAGFCRSILERVDRRARSMDATHVILSTSLPASLYCAARLSRGGRRIWIDLDDWSTGQLLARGGSPFVGGAYALLERWLPRRAHGITVCSRELETLYPRSHWIPNFVRLDKIPPPSPVRGEPGRLKVAFAGAITAYHGHEAFLAALARRQHDCKALRFVIAGGGDRLASCRERARELRLGDDLVHFTGALDRHVLLEQLRACDIGILPLWDTRVHRARFPLKLLDYLACGCAVVGSEVGMVQKILGHRESAWLAPPGDMPGIIDGVLALASDESLRRRLAACGADLVRQYDAARICGQWRDLLEADTAGR